MLQVGLLIVPCDVSLSDPCAVVSGRGEAEGTSRGLGHALHFLAAHCCVSDIPFPVPHTAGAQNGMRSSRRITWLEASSLS